MSIYRYQKDTNYSDTPAEYFEPEITTQGEKTTIWKILSSTYRGLQGLVNTSSLANVILPTIFILVGMVFIYLQFHPKIQAFLVEKSEDSSVLGALLQGTISPVEDEYIDLAEYISNPAGITELSKQAFKSDILQIDTVSQNYRGTFYISIPNLGINKLPVTANVDSTTESAYNAVLDNSLAHFQNTSLPISDIANNIVIYGHSASPTYNPKPTDPQVAFSFLQDLKVGDEINLYFGDEEYKFKMQKSKIVEPTDVSIITGTRGKKSLTLFTCYPNGSNAYRYVAIARPVF